MKKKFGLLMTIILSMLFLVACGGSGDKKEGGDAGASTGKDTLVIAQGADAKSLDPHASNDNPSSRIRVQIYDRLMDLDDNGVPQPMLAESWERPDDKTIIFHLRKGVKFHNGDEMKASDVKFSLERALAAPEVSHILTGINGVEVLDDYTVKVTTEKPMAAILNNLAHTTIAILSEKATKEAGDKFGQNPVGSGPYKFVSWQSGDRVTLEAFPEYWQGEAPIKNVVFRNIVEETNRTIGLETGELDIIYDIQGMDKNKLKDDDRFVVIEGPQVSMTYLGFNMKKAPYDNPKVREAISYAIDQKPIIDTVFLGAGEAANSIIGPNVWGYADVEKFTQDVEKAKAEVKRIENQLETLNAKLKEAKANVTSTQEEIANNNKEIETLTNSIKELKEQLKGQEKTLEEKLKVQKEKEAIYLKAKEAADVERAKIAELKAKHEEAVAQLEALKNEQAREEQRQRELEDYNRAIDEVLYGTNSVSNQTPTNVKNTLPVTNTSNESIFMVIGAVILAFLAGLGLFAYKKNNKDDKKED